MSETTAPFPSVLLRALSDDELVVVGPAALSLWAARLGLASALAERAFPITVMTDEASAARIAARAEFTRVESPTPARHELARLAFAQSEAARAVLIVSRVAGARAPVLRGRAVPFAVGERTVLRVMHPVDLLSSTLADATTSERGASPAHAALAVQCAHAFLRQRLAQGKVKEVLRLNEEVHRAVMSPAGVLVANRDGVDVVNAIVIDPALPDEFRNVRYPAMLLALCQRKGSAAAPRPSVRAETERDAMLEVTGIRARGADAVLALADANGRVREHVLANARNFRVGDRVRVGTNGEVLRAERTLRTPAR